VDSGLYCCNFLVLYHSYRFQMLLLGILCLLNSDEDMLLNTSPVPGTNLWRPNLVDWGGMELPGEAVLHRPGLNSPDLYHCS
jgi:hypothetical protein